MRVYQFRHIRALPQQLHCATRLEARPGPAPRTISVLRRVFLIVLAAFCAAALAGSAARARPPQAFVDVVVLVNGPPRVVEERIESVIPSARVRWRYEVVLDGMSVAIPKASLPELRLLPGVAEVHESVTYGPTLYSSPGFIGAPALWGAALQSSSVPIRN